VLGGLPDADPWTQLATRGSGDLLDAAETELYRTEAAIGREFPETSFE